MSNIPDPLFPEVIEDIEEIQQDEKEQAKQRQLANLKKYEKGQSGNPDGRPPGKKSIAEYIVHWFKFSKEEADARFFTPGISGNERTALNIVRSCQVDLLIKKTDKQGNVWFEVNKVALGAIQDMMDRLFGKATVKIEMDHTHNSDNIQEDLRELTKALQDFHILPAHEPSKKLPHNSSEALILSEE